MFFKVLVCFAISSIVSGSIPSGDSHNFDGLSDTFTYPDETAFVLVKLSHAFNSSLNYQERAVISISNNIPNIVQSPINGEALSLLKDSAIAGDIYYLKAEAYRTLDVKNSEPYQVSSTFLRACSFLESSLTDQLILNLDATGKFVSLSANVPDHSCESTEPSVAVAKMHDIERALDNNFNSTILMSKTTVCQGPETKTYLQRIDQEKMEKTKTSQQDNRSFISKYWMYIVPVVIFMFISSAVNPEGGASQ